jgi:drug/metabolite transporter (DMT)-like permease
MTGHSRRRSPLAIVSPLLIVAAWGLSYAAIRAAVREIPPFSLAFLRFLLATLIVWPIYRRGERRAVDPGDRWPLLLLGLTGVTLYFAFENTGLQYTTASHGAMIAATIPLGVELVAARRSGTRLPRQAVAASLVALAGVFVLVRPGIEDGASLAGDLLMFGAAASWVAYTFLAERLAGRYPGMQVTHIIQLVGVATFLPGALAETLLSPRPWPSAGAWGGVAFLGIVCTAAAYHVWNRAIADLGVTTASNLLYGVPMVGVLGGVLLLGEPFTPSLAVGSALILTGVIWANRAARIPGHPESPPG